MSKQTVQFRPLSPVDLAMLHDWLRRPHVAQRWDSADDYAQTERDFLPLTESDARTRGYVAWLNHEPIGFIQSYEVKDCGEGWWEQEKDVGARGIDQFLANEADLGKGLGTRMVRDFIDFLFQNPAVTKIQTDPAPDNVRAIRCYEKSGFVAQHLVQTPDGIALLMLKRRPTFA